MEYLSLQVPPHPKMLTGMKKTVSRGQLIPKANRSKARLLNRINISLARLRAMVQIHLLKSLGGPHPRETSANHTKTILRHKLSSNTILSLSELKLLISRDLLAAIDAGPHNTL